MLKLLSFVLELLRLCILFVLTLLILGWLEKNLYELKFGIEIYYSSMTLGNTLIFLILYRNYFQFKGWYKSEENKKLSKVTTRNLAVLSLILIIIPIG